MKRSTRWMLMVASSAALALAGHQAARAENITISDQYAGGQGFNGGPTGQGQEDNATEPGTINNQGWDYEAMFVDTVNAKLGLIAGFDMKSGKVNNYVSPQGDIFIKVNSRVDAHLTTGGGGDTVDFDYVIHFTQVPPPPPEGSGFTGTDYWTSGSIQYAVYAKSQVDYTTYPTGDGAITGGSALLKNWLWQAEPKSGEVAIYSASDALYANNQTAAQVQSLTGVGGLLGDAQQSHHDVLSGIDLDFASLSAGGKDVYFYTTVGCGNDILEGKYHVVPDGGATLVLMAMGLAGVGLGMRRNVV